MHAVVGPRRGARALIALAILAVTACTADVAPSATTTASPGVSPSASPAPSEPSTTPEPSVPTTVEWLAANVPDSANASSTVSIVPGGDGLVAIGFDGAFGTIVWTSADGRKWTDVTTDAFAPIGIASVIPTNEGLVGVGRGDTINVDADAAAAYLSDDGITWRQAASGEEMRGQLIDVVETGDGLFAVGGVPGEDAAGVWRSPDGEIWERSGADIDHAFMWAIAEGGPGLVAVGWRRNPEPDLAVWTSTDGTEWTLAPDPEGSEGFEATDVIAADDGTLVMVGSGFQGEGGRIWTSDDGFTWELADVAGGMDGAFARTLAATPYGLLAVGGTDAMEGVAWISPDGRSWQPFGDRLPGAFFVSAHATDSGLVLAGATQGGTLETGVESHAMVWTGTP